MNNKRGEYTVKILIVFIVVLLIILFYSILNSIPEAEVDRAGNIPVTEESEPAEDTAPDMPAQPEQPEEPETPPEPEEEQPEETPTPTTMISDVKCNEDGIISLVLTNLNSKSAKVGKDFKVFAGNLLNLDPGCEKTEIDPGESTLCSDVGKHPFSSKVRVLVLYPGMRETETVDCTR